MAGHPNEIKGRIVVVDDDREMRALLEDFYRSDGYEVTAFPVATDAACRNRLLHSRPIDGAEFLPRLWRAGIRGYHAVFNAPGDDIMAIVRGYRAALDALTVGTKPDLDAVRKAVGEKSTKPHVARFVDDIGDINSSQRRLGRDVF